ncbi:MAG: hypothetical protein GF381_01495 [Candidatus Pacebacteria bacterium]|nr:hypothetical protein [Candidatus Paceibacterota bacterium]
MSKNDDDYEITLKKLHTLLKFGHSQLQKHQHDLDKYNFKQSVLFTTMPAVQSYCESIERLLSRPPYFDKAAEVLFRSLIEALINTNYVFAHKGQKHALSFMVDSIRDRIDFAKKHQRFWGDHLSWNLSFGSIKKPQGWDNFIADKKEEIQEIKEKLNVKRIPNFPRLRNRAELSDAYLQSKGELNEQESLEKYYVLYYKHFSQLAHLSSEGLSRFFDKNGSSLNIDGTKEDARKVLGITYQVYLSLLKLFNDEFAIFDPKELKKFSNFSEKLIQ